MTKQTGDGEELPIEEGPTRRLPATTMYVHLRLVPTRTGPALIGLR